MARVRLDGVRLTELVPGGPDRGPVARFMVCADGVERGVSVYAGQTPYDKHADELFRQMATLLPEASAAVEVAQVERDRAVETARRAETAARRASDRLRAVLDGRSLFGEALVVQADDGSVWLQDPEKRDRGMGIRFASLSELWAEFPQLRPVRWDGGDLVVAAWRLPGTTTVEAEP